MGPQRRHRGLPRRRAYARPRAASLLSVQQLVLPQQRDVHQPGVGRVKDGAILPPACPANFDARLRQMKMDPGGLIFRECSLLRASALSLPMLHSSTLATQRASFHGVHSFYATRGCSASF